MTVVDVLELRNKLQSLIQNSNPRDDANTQDISISEADVEESWSYFLCLVEQSPHNHSMKKDFLPTLIKACLLHYENATTNSVFQKLVNPWKRGSWEVLLMMSAFVLNKQDAPFLGEFILYNLFKSLTMSSTWIVNLWEELEENYNDLSLQVKTLEFLVVNHLSTLPTKLNASTELISSAKLLWDEQKFYTKIMVPAFALLLDKLCREYNSSNSYILVNCLHSMWTKWSRLGHSKEFSISLLLFKTLSSLPNHIINLIIEILPPSDLATIDFHIFSYIEDIEHVSNNIEHQLVISMHHLHSILKRSLISPLGLFQSVLTNENMNIYSICSLVQIVLENYNNHDILSKIVKHWEIKARIQNDSLDILIHRTKLVIFSLAYCFNFKKSMDHGVSSILMSGISNYLDAQTANVRYIGMFMAEFHAILNSKKICFDKDFYESSEYLLLKQFDAFSRSVVGHDIGTQILGEYVENNVLKNYDTSEDEFESSAQSNTPVVLGESISLLKSQDKAKIAVALDCLVNKHQIQNASNMTIGHVASSLVTILIYLSFEDEDKDDRENDALRTHAILELLYRKSDTCIQVLLNELWSPNLVLIQRLYILSLFSRCCKEFSSVKDHCTNVTESLYLSMRDLTIVRDNGDVDGVKTNHFSQNMSHKIFYGLINPHVDCIFTKSEYYYDNFIEKLLLCLTLIIYHSTSSLHHSSMMCDMFHFMLESDVVLISKSFKVHTLRLSMLKSFSLMISLQTSSNNHLWSKKKDAVLWGKLYSKLEEWLQAPDWNEIILDKEQYILKKDLISVVKYQFKSMMSAGMYCLLE